MNWLTENPVSKYVYNKLVKWGCIFPSRSPAEIFKHVIKIQGYVRGSLEQPVFMCSSLCEAEWLDDISPKERKIAKQALEEYMESLGYSPIRPLSLALIHAFPGKYNYNNVWDACYEIYQDWDNRPMKGE